MVFYIPTAYKRQNGLPPPIKIHSTDGKSQLIWPNNLPPYMQKYQNLAFQQIPPYPGYMFSGMQANPTYYPGMTWPPNLEVSSQGPGSELDYNWKNNPPSKNKKKYSNGDRHDSNNQALTTILMTVRMIRKFSMGKKKHPKRRDERGFYLAWWRFAALNVQEDLPFLAGALAVLCG
ncbi:hypothetical protein RND71_015963 [Anisodus tanguticus]|uniref:Uncharacterized protein n=1 Tax=Anisodus tanguticus TaxID=243964 RepID=A0AAE1S6W1_9SOLA|nr:hypothetical protein RND71_015963 [Anisodus tanguticus]